jgi:hypothetical protein
MAATKLEKRKANQEVQARQAESQEAEEIRE